MKYFLILLSLLVPSLAAQEKDLLDDLVGQQTEVCRECIPLSGALRGMFTILSSLSLDIISGARVKECIESVSKGADSISYIDACTIVSQAPYILASNVSHLSAQQLYEIAKGVAELSRQVSQR